IGVSGCSTSSATRQPPPGSRELHEKLLITYTEHYIKTKEFDEAERFVTLIPPDSKYADRVPELKRQIEQLIAEHDASIVALYNESDKVPIELQADLYPREGDQINVGGKAKLPRNSRLTVSLWREDPNGWRMLDEQMIEIGPGSKFQTVLAAYRQGEN